MYKYCLRCGRRLISDEARIRGYGKICEEKAKKQAKKRPLINKEGVK